MLIKTLALVTSRESSQTVCDAPCILREALIRHDADGKREKPSSATVHMRLLVKCSRSSS